jgi:hypothetical protein
MRTYSLQTNNVLEVPDLGISTNTIVFCNTSCELTNTTHSLVRIGLKSELVQDWELEPKDVQHVTNNEKQNWDKS